MSDPSNPPLELVVHVAQVNLCLTPEAARAAVCEWSKTETLNEIQQRLVSEYEMSLARARAASWEGVLLMGRVSVVEPRGGHYLLQVCRSDLRDHPSLKEESLVYFHRKDVVTLLPDLGDLVYFILAKGDPRNARWVKCASCKLPLSTGRPAT